MRTTIPQVGPLAQPVPPNINTAPIPDEWKDFARWLYDKYVEPGSDAKFTDYEVSEEGKKSIFDYFEELKLLTMSLDGGFREDKHFETFRYRQIYPTIIGFVHPNGVVPDASVTVPEAGSVLSAEDETDSDGVYLPNELATKIDCGGDTLNKYAKWAGVETPGIGVRNREYTARDIVLICKEFLKRSKTAKHKRNATTLLEKYQTSS